MVLESVNPATGEHLSFYPVMAPGEVRAILGQSRAAFLRWRETPFSERSEPLRRAAGILREDSDRYARLMALEMGKPLAQGRAEALKCAWVCDYYAENAERFLSPEEVLTDARSSFIAFEPLGPVLAVMPWNFPFWQVLRFAAPALMAGNAALLKHASNVQGCALAIEELFHRAGYPEDLFRTLVLGGDRVAEVIDQKEVVAVTLTGSTPAGREVAARAGRNLKKSVLELGGSDPYVILDDADLDAAVESCVVSRLINSGQSCIAAKRFIVTDARRSAFEQLFVQMMREKTWGDPSAGDFDIGPMARDDLRDELHDQVRRSVAAGARCLLGGKVPEGPGAWYPPTVLTDVRAGTPAYEEEMFGPVAAIVPVANEEEAIRAANDTSFGLGAAVFTRDVGRGEEIARRRLEAGACFVNAFVQSDPRLPFGGVKESGYGRELGSFGVREFVNVKSVWVA